MINWLESAVQNVRLALRGWRRSPGFAVVAVSTLALGIGANTAIVSAFYAVVLRPLPFKDSDSVVYMTGDVPSRPGTMTLVLPMSDIPRLRAESTTLSSISPLMLDDVLIGVGGGNELVRMRRARIAPAALDLLNVHPALGRLFGPHDADLSAEPVTILSNATWQTQFASDPHVIGRRITTGGAVHTVIGVMPQGFAFPSSDIQVWSVIRLPLSLPDVERVEESAGGAMTGRSGAATEGSPSSQASDRGALIRPESPGRGQGDPRATLPPSGNQFAVTIARINSGVSLETATAEINTLFVGMHPRYARALSQGKPPPLKLVRVKDQMVAPVRAALLMLLGAAALLLFIACSNVAWLLLVRAIGRRQEIGMRVALGASAGRVIREVLTESVILALFGGLAGSLLAMLGLQFLNVLHGGTIPRLGEVTVDRSFLLIGLTSSVVTCLVSGLVPAVRIARSRLVPFGSNEVAHGGVVGRLSGRRVAPSVLTIAQVSSAVVLLIAAGLLLQSFVNLTRLDLGYDPDHVLTFEVRMPRDRYSDAERLGVYAELLERLPAISGATSVAATARLPTQPGGGVSGLVQVPGSADRIPANLTPVSARYLDVMRLRVMAGRWFDYRDRAGGPVSIVVSKHVAASFPDGQAIDRIVQLNGPFERIPLHVVGVVEDTLTGGLDGVARPDIYISVDQWPRESQFQAMLRSMWFVIRTDDDPMPLAPTVRSLVRQIEPSLFADNIASMQRLVSLTVERPRAYAALLGTFAVVAVVISLVGIGGLVAYIVSGRTYEIGVRMALGARRAQILRLVLGQSVAVMLIGISVGLAGAAATTRYLQGLLFGLTPLDMMIFGAVAMTFAAMAVFAAYIPARRALKVDPLVSLRSE